jgi:hypothetical protein
MEQLIKITDKKRRQNRKKLLNHTCEKSFSVPHSGLLGLDVAESDHRLGDNVSTWIDNEADRRIDNRMGVHVTHCNLFDQSSPLIYKQACK